MKKIQLKIPLHTESLRILVNFKLYKWIYFCNDFCKTSNDFCALKGLTLALATGLPHVKGLPQILHMFRVI